MSFFIIDNLFFAMGGAIPVIIHLLHRQKYKRVRWAAMEFLLAAIRKTQRRLRLENLLLLLLRALIMIILAFALAKPFFREAPLEAMAESDTHYIFVVDNSASMGYKKAQESTLDVARKTAVARLEAIRKLTEMDRISVVLMSSSPDAFVLESRNKEKAAAAIYSIPLSHYGTSAFLTLQKIREMVEASRNQRKVVMVFTDFQRNAWEAADETEGRRFQELTKFLGSRQDVQFQLVDVGAEGADNRAVVELKCENAVVTTRESARFTVTVHNFSAVNYPAVAVNLYVNGNLLKTESVTLPAASSMSFAFRHDFIEPGPHLVEASTEPDFLDVDDRRLLALDVRDGLRGALVDGEPGTRKWESEIDYLAVVLDPAGDGRRFKLDRATVGMFDAEHLEKYDFVTLCNVQSLTQDKVEKLERFVQGGGGLFITLGGLVDKGWYNEFLFREGKGLLPARLLEVEGSPPDREPRVPIRIQDYRAGHPIFSPFAKGLEKQPRELIFYQYYRLERFETEGVIASLDDGASTPLFVEKRFGEGRVVLFNNAVDTDADATWNLQLPGRIPYLILMRRTAEHLSARMGNQYNLFVGDIIALMMSADKYLERFELETPNEGLVPISSEPLIKDSPVFWLRHPRPDPPAAPGEPPPPPSKVIEFAGRYALNRPSARPDERPIALFAVNLPPRQLTPEDLHHAEGNLDRISEDEIRARLPDFKFQMAGKRGAAEETVELAAPPSGLWTYLLYVLMGFIALETVLAWLFGRAKQ